MGQIEEFKINPLPSITWNWLRLNDVNVKWNMDIEPCNIEIKEDNNEKAKDLANRFINNFKKYETNDEGKALVEAGPKL